MGVTTLIVGPLLAAAVSTPATAIHGTAAAISHPAAAVLAGKHLRVQIPEIAERETPAPTPAPPAPQPIVRPVIVHVAVPPRPVAPPVNYPPGSVAAIIMAAAAAYGVDGQWMIRIAQCESGMTPSRNSGNGYYGMFQYLPSTFAAHGGTNIFDPVQQSNITANMLAHGGAGSWPVCSRR